MKEEMLGDETYIGDGVYASFDGYMIKLRADRDFQSHVIYLEQEVYESLVDFTRRFGLYDCTANRGVK